MKLVSLAVALFLGATAAFAMSSQAWDVKCVDLTCCLRA
jgi:hypothetical protein